MGVTNYEHTLNTFALLVKERGIAEVLIRSINTGSNTYRIRMRYTPSEGEVKFSIDKVYKTGRFLGTIDIDRVSEYGLEYRSKSLGSIPASVSKAIVQSYMDANKLLNTHRR